MTESALAGIRVLELSRVLAGPWCAMTLADLGADVIKVESPDGDETRGLGPPFRDGMSAYFACCNRNKRSIAIDLRAADSKPLIGALARWADVVVENFRTGVAERLGVDYESLASLNPRLIYCSISGYGRDGPAAQRPGYDYVIQAEAGLMAITGPADGAPHKVGVAVADLFTGQNATTAILAALLHRERTGEGQRVEVSLFDSQLQMLANVGSSARFTGDDAARYGNAHPSIVPYQAFDAADRPFVVAVASEKLWSLFCAAIERPDLSDDPRYRTNADRVRLRGELIAQLQTLFAHHDAAHWLQRLGDAGVPCAPINGVLDALRHPVAQAREMCIDIDGVPLIGSALKLEGTPVTYHRAPPALDADRAGILEELGLE